MENAPRGHWARLGQCVNRTHPQRTARRDGGSIFQDVTQFVQGRAIRCII